MTVGPVQSCLYPVSFHGTLRAGDPRSTSLGKTNQCRLRSYSLARGDVQTISHRKRCRDGNGSPGGTEIDDEITNPPVLRTDLRNYLPRAQVAEVSLYLA